MYICMCLEEAEWGSGWLLLPAQVQLLTAPASCRIQTASLGSVSLHLAREDLVLRVSSVMTVVVLFQIWTSLNENVNMSANQQECQRIT